MQLSRKCAGAGYSLQSSTKFIKRKTRVIVNVKLKKGCGELQ